MTARTQILIGLSSLALTTGLAVVRDRLPEHTGNVLTDAPRRIADILLPRDSDVISAVVPNGTTVAGMLGKHLLPQSELSALVQAVTSTFDVRKLRAGNIYKIDRMLDGRIRSFEYEIDPTRALRASRRDGDIALFEAEVVQLPLTTTSVVVEGTIDREAPSISESIERAGERLDLALAMADIFSGEIDFNSGMQAGDTYRLVVEKSVRDDGLFVGYGPVKAAEFVTGGRTLSAMRFTLPGGTTGYFDTAGRSLKRFFLKSPLKFEPRITSRFSRSRMHPVLKYARAHNGVDYAAPDGRAGRQRVGRRRDAGRLDQRRRPHGAHQAHERLRERVPAPVGDRCRRPGRHARRPGRAGGQCRHDRARHGRAPALRTAPERPLRQPDHRAPEPAAG